MANRENTLLIIALTTATTMNVFMYNYDILIVVITSVLMYNFAPEEFNN
jgi:hypothetical protein